MLEIAVKRKERLQFIFLLKMLENENDNKPTHGRFIAYTKG